MQASQARWDSWIEEPSQEEGVIRMGNIMSEADFFAAIQQVQRVHQYLDTYPRWVIDVTEMAVLPLALRSLLCGLCEAARRQGREIALLGLRPEHNLGELCPECVPPKE